MQLYVLKLRNRKWYIGTTSQKVEARFEQHKNGDGAEWTKVHHPLAIEDHRPILQGQDWTALETKETYKYMLIYGVNNVRGGPCIDVADFSTDYLEKLVVHIGHTLDMEFRHVRERLGLHHPRASPKSKPTKQHPGPRKVSAQPDRKKQRPTKQSETVAPFSVCAKCGADKTANQSKPICTPCWTQLASDYAFAICPCCGTDNDGDPDRPLCPDCYHSWMDGDGAVCVAE